MAFLYARSTRRAASTDDGGSSGSPSHQTIIIVAACASVGGLVLVYILFRLIRRSCNRSATESAPLPPVQPLAHYREQQLAKYEDRTSSRRGTFYDASYLSPRPFTSSSASFRTSNASLLAKDRMPSRETSSINFSETAESMSLSQSSTMIPMEPALSIPNPPFGISKSASSSSFGSSDNDASNVGQSNTPPSIMSSSSHGTGNFRQDRPSRTLSSPSPAPRSRPSRTPSRPVSMASHASSLSRTSRSNLRGVPHAPYSNVQIVLPAPLAPGLFPYTPGDEVLRSDSHARLSMVDQWAPKAVRSESSSFGERLESRAEASSSSHPSRAHPRSLSQPGRPPPRIHTISSHSSRSSFSSIPSPTSPLSRSPLPPVPRIPSMYSGSPSGSSSPLESDNVYTESRNVWENEDRGRLEDIGSASADRRSHSLPPVPQILPHAKPEKNRGR